MVEDTKLTEIEIKDEDHSKKVEVVFTDSTDNNKMS